jgi:hypothetical protein
MAAGEHLQRAIAYVAEHGEPLQRARLATILGAEPPDPASPAYAHWLAGRNADGGWGAVGAAAREGSGARPSTLLSTLRALRYARELRLGVTAEVRTALLWIHSRQRRDGSFQDREDAARSPDASDAAFLTAAALLALDWWLVGVPVYDEVRDHAYGWLRTHLRRPTEHGPRTLWPAAAAALRREGSDSPFALAMLGHLTGRLDGAPTAWDACDLADLVITLVEAKWPVSATPTCSALRYLPSLQRPDGAFVQPGITADPAEATLRCARAYRLIQSTRDGDPRS